MADTPRDPRDILAGPDAVEVEVDLPEAEGDVPEDGGPGELFGTAPPAAPARRARRPSPFRGPVHWVDLPIPPSLVLAWQAWVAQHPTLPVETAPGTVQTVAVATLPLEQSWDLFLRDVVSRDIAGDLDRTPDAQQYNFAAWIVGSFPAHLRAALAQEAAQQYEATLRTWRATFRDLLLKAARHQLSDDEVLAIFAQEAQEATSDG